MCLTGAFCLVLRSLARGSCVPHGQTLGLFPMLGFSEHPPLGGIIFQGVPLAALWGDAVGEAAMTTRAEVTVASAAGVAGVGVEGWALGLEAPKKETSSEVVPVSGKESFRVGVVGQTPGLGSRELASEMPNRQPSWASADGKAGLGPPVLPLPGPSAGGGTPPEKGLLAHTQTRDIPYPRVGKMGQACSNRGFRTG